MKKLLTPIAVLMLVTVSLSLAERVGPEFPMQPGEHSDATKMLQQMSGSEDYESVFSAMASETNHYLESTGDSTDRTGESRQC